MKRLLYVVHRYYPYPGGSESNVRSMAEESLKRGHDVTVLTDRHKGDQNGVKVTSDLDILNEFFDLIIVHGGYSYPQNHVLKMAPTIKSEILYLLIESATAKIHPQGLMDSDFFGYCTQHDLRFLRHLGITKKIEHVRHSIIFDESIGAPGFREKYGITTRKMVISSGGFWPNKMMRELNKTFLEAAPEDTTLVLLGYGQFHLAPPESKYVKVLKGLPREDVLSGIREADLYVLNSSFEGFGLVLLETMLNKTPWVSKKTPGAEVLAKYGSIYANQDELKSILRTLVPKDAADSGKIEESYELILNSYGGQQAVDDIEAVLNKSVGKTKPLRTFRLKIFRWEHFMVTLLPSIKAKLRIFLNRILKKSVHRDSLPLSPEERSTKPQVLSLDSTMNNKRRAV